MKVCTKCGVEKPRSEFGKNRGQCKPCRAEIGRAWRETNRERVLETDRAWREANPDKVRARSRRRRALKLTTPTDPYTNAEPRTRDGDACQLCGDTIDFDLEYPNPMSQSVDHVVPLSLGGSDLKSNVQLAHLTCNIAKGNRIE